MSNGTVLNAGSGGDTLATLDTSGASNTLTGKVQAGVLYTGTAPNALNPVSSTSPLATQPVASENHIGAIGGSVVRSDVEFTRPANTTAYTAGDAVNNSTTAPVVVTMTSVARVSGGNGYITKVRIMTDKKSITPRLRAYVWNASSPTMVNDNLAFEMLYADIAKLIGIVDLPALDTPADTTNSTISWAEIECRLPFVASGSTSIYVSLATLDAFTPASGEKFTVSLWVDQN